MENIDKIADVSFHGVDYILKITVRDDQMFAEIEQKDNGHRWKNSFSAVFLEDLTQKTGNFKKFPVFVKMLLSSIQKNSESVYLDILTYQDLEMLKARKQKSNASSTAQSIDKLKTNNKRYMILTYAVEFDKVHYPLPLNFEENPDVEALKATIRRLRNEIDDIKSDKHTNTRASQDSGAGGFFMTQDPNTQGQDKDSKADISSLKAENDNLKQKVRKLEESQIMGSGKKGSGGGAVEYDLLLKNKMELESELEGVKKDYIKDVRRLKLKLEETEKELDEARDDLIKMKEDPDRRNNSRTLDDTESELLASKKIISKHQKEVDRLSQDLEGMKAVDKKSKARIRQLEIELESALKRNTYSRGSNAAEKVNSPYNRSRGNSPTGSANKRASSLPTRNFSPSSSKQSERKPTPTKRPVQVKAPSRTSTGSDTESNPRGVLKARNANNSPLRINGMGSDPLKKFTPKRDQIGGVYGGARKQSPSNNRAYSPSSRLNNQSPVSRVGAKPSPKATSGRQYGYLANDNSNNKNRGAIKNNYMMDDSEEESNSRKGGNSNPNTKKTTINPSAQNTISSTSNNKLKLKENILDFKESKLSSTKGGTQEFGKSDLSANMLDSSLDVEDIDQRLNKLQDLLKKAKS
jgi:coiled-coil domain-containing protein 61